MRRLVALTSATVLYNTIFLVALTPLLPVLAARFDLSKSESGLLVGAYAAGVLAAALPAGLVVSRLGVRATVVAGLALMSAASVLFAWAPNVWLLDAARFGQGAASAIGWTGALAWLVGGVPVPRRGAVIGFTMSATVVGALLGPALGGLADVAGLRSTFSAVALVGVALGLWAWATPAPSRAAPQPLRALIGGLATQPRLRLGAWLGALTALIYGAVSVLAPLRLGELGWGALGVGAAYFVAAVGQTVWSPVVGRWSDARGRLAPVRVALAASVLALPALAWALDAWTVAFLVVVAALVTSVLWVCGVAVVADATDAAALQHGLGFSLMNLAWAPGHFVGAALGGAVAGALGDALPYLALAGTCAVTLALLPRRRHDRAPERLEPDFREAV